MSNLTGLVQMVQEAIEKGATSVEEVHKTIAAKPFEILSKIGPIETTVGTMQDLHNQTVGNVYEFIRTMNTKISEIAKELLAKVEPQPATPSK